MKRIKNISNWRKVSMALWSSPREAIRYTSINLDVTLVPYEELRKTGITWTHLLVQWLTQTITRYPELNRHVIRNSLYQKDDIDIFVRMSFKERDQLWGCYFRRCQDKNLNDIQEQLVRVKGEALKKKEISLHYPVWLIRLGLKLTQLPGVRKLLPDYMSPTVSLSNLGTFKIPPFDSLPNFVLSSPILVCAGSTFEQDGKLFLPLSIGLDHRVIDGDLAGDLINELMRRPRDDR